MWIQRVYNNTNKVEEDRGPCLFFFSRKVVTIHLYIYTSIHHIILKKKEDGEHKSYTILPNIPIWIRQSEITIS